MDTHAYRIGPPVRKRRFTRIALWILGWDRLPDLMFTAGPDGWEPDAINWHVHIVDRKLQIDHSEV